MGFDPTILLPHAQLTTKGYCIDAALLEPEIRLKALEYLLDRHHIQPTGHPDHKKPEAWSNLRLHYQEHKWYLPRAWASIHIGVVPFKTLENEIEHLPDEPFSSLFDLGAALRPYQVKASEKVSQYLTNKMPTGIVELPTAWGKSFFAIYMARYFAEIRPSSSTKFKVLIVVHNTEIGAEWQKTIRMFCSERDGLIALLDGKHKDHVRYPDAPFLIATVQTLNNLPASVELGPFEFVILDEVHHYGARTFSQVNYVTNGKYMLGLSATPHRKDGLGTVLEAHIGQLFYREEITIQPSRWTLHVHHVKFTPHVKRMYVTKSKSMEETFQSKITALSGCEARNEYIANIIVNLYQTNPARRLIAFAERKEPLYQIDAFLKKICTDTLRVQVYTGREKQQKVKLEEVLKSSDVILTTYSIFGEGISSDRLNGIVIVTGLAGGGRMKQPIGRILRKPHEDIDVVVVDLNDEILPGLVYNRIKQYKERMGISGMKQIHWKNCPETNLPVLKKSEIFERSADSA